MRNLNQEFNDTDERKYAYDFDYRMHGYLMRTFEPYLQNADSALEMGCYQGEFTRLLAARFASVTVIEGSDLLIQQAQQNVASDSVSFVHSRFEQAALRQQFDAVFLIHTLEHLDEPVQVLKKIKQWLSPTGSLYVVVPNANALSRQIAVNMGLIAFNSAVTPGEYEHGHRKTYSLDTLAHEVQSSGLTIKHRGGVFVKPLANFQLDRLIANNIADEKYFEACYQLSEKYPDLCASIYCICSRNEHAL